MRVYTKAVSVWDPVLERYVTDEAESEWYEYEGPVAEAKGGSKSAKREAARQRAEEEARQARIKLGMTEIDNIFSGYYTGKNQFTDPNALDANATYYDAKGQERRFTPMSDSALLSKYTPAAPARQNIFGMSMGGPIYGNNSFMGGGLYGYGGSPRDNAADLAQYRKQERQDFLDAGTFTARDYTPGFDDSFYEGRRTAYLDYAKPQLEDQFGEQSRNLTFALARGGNLESSLAAERKAKLLTERDQRVLDLGNEAQNLVNTTKQTVEGARSDLVNQLYATGDNTLASQNAMRQAANLAAKPGFSPIGQLFNDAAGSIGAYAGGRRYGAIQDQIDKFDNKVRSPFATKSVSVG